MLALVCVAAGHAAHLRHTLEDVRSCLLHTSDPADDDEPVARPAGQLAFWVIADELPNDLDEVLLRTVLDWFATDWPLATVVVPLRVENERGIRVATEMGLTRRPGIADEHVEFVWSRSGNDS